MLRHRAAYEFMPVDDFTIKVLHERAAVLSKLHQQKKDNGKKVSYIHFILGNNQSYGIDYSSIKEVMHNVIITKVPRAAPYIAGIINRRGILLPIVDLKKVFGIEEKYAESMILVVKSQSTILGLLVDHVIDSDSYDSLSLQKPISPQNKMKIEYFLGLHRGRTAILNIDFIINDLLQMTQKR